MSLRTSMLKVARPGPTLSMRMPSAWAARSRDHIASATASASACGSVGMACLSVMDRLSGKDALLDQRRDAVAVLAVKAREVGEHRADGRQADTVGPFERPARAVHVQLHRRIGRRRIAYALVDLICGFVG